MSYVDFILKFCFKILFYMKLGCPIPDQKILKVYQILLNLNSHSPSVNGICCIDIGYNTHSYCQNNIHIGEHAYSRVCSNELFWQEFRLLYPSQDIWSVCSYVLLYSRVISILMVRQVFPEEKKRSATIISESLKKIVVDPPINSLLTIIHKVAFS